MGINGEGGQAEDLQVALASLGRECQGVRLKMQRFPETFELIVKKGFRDQLCGVRMGIFEGDAPPMRCLIVAEVQNDGLVGYWNCEAAQKGNFHLMVTPGLEIFD